MKLSRLILSVAVVASLAASCGFLYKEIRDEPPGKPFLVKPYIQLGNNPSLNSLEKLELLWHGEDVDEDWKVEVRRTEDPAWKAVQKPKMRRATLGTLRPRRLYTAELTNLPPGQAVEYRVSHNGVVAFEAKAVARKSKTQPFRFAVVGDMGAGTEGQRKVAHHLSASRPDMLMLTGDITYDHGTYSEYLQRFFPVYNADPPSVTGVPLMRSSLMIAAAGNHDVDVGAFVSRNLDMFRDGLAYFYLFSQPLNGPLGRDATANIPQLLGNPALQQSFLSLAGDNYPRMTNYSFDYGNTHWTVLDANLYMDWTDPKLVNWLKDDLKNSSDATWHFVAFHQSPFSTGRAHFREQHMRVLSPVFAEGGVDMVFTGHMHNYQRTYPLTFTPQVLADGRFVSAEGTVSGELRLDKKFDGRTDQTPEGVIYIVSGAGGRELNSEKLTYEPQRWQPYTAKFVAAMHSFTVCDINGKELTLRQISEDGTELDRVQLSKQPALVPTR